MPFTPSNNLDEMMKMFDPERIAKLFGADQFLAVFKPAKELPFDINALIASNAKNVEALQAANKSAASAYQNFFRKQMEIFGEVTDYARDQMKSIEGSDIGDIAKRQQDIYRASVEKALELMTEFANATKAAHDEAAKIIDGRIKEALAEVQRG